jgi:hypothetical protein
MTKPSIIHVPEAVTAFKGWTIFNKEVLSTAFKKAQIAWLSETAGKIIKRGAKGRFLKPEAFVIVNHSRKG